MLIIDRFEGQFVVVQDSEKEKTVNIPKEFIQEGAKEGDVLALFETFYMIDYAQTKKRREEVLALEKSIGKNHR